MESTETITISKAEYDSLLGQIALLKHQFAELQRMVFGAKSERFIAPTPNQPTLFEIPEPEVTEKPKEEIIYTRSKPEPKNQPLRLELAAHLPRKVEVIEPADLPEGAIKIGENITEVLDYVPSTVFVRQIVRPKYIVSQDDEQTRIITAALPRCLFQKAMQGRDCWHISWLVSSLIIYRFTVRSRFLNVNSLLFLNQPLAAGSMQVADYLNHYTIHLKAGWLPPII